MSTVIFDFDGTLADTLPLIAELTSEFVYKAAPDENELTKLRRIPLLRAMRQMCGWWLLVPILSSLVRRKMYSKMGNGKIFAGIPEVLRTLKGDGHRLMIFTTNNVINVHESLRIHGLETYFDRSDVYHGRIFTKGSGLKHLVEHSGIANSQCVYVGNETIDVRAAKKAGVRSVAVLWSGTDEDALRQTSPDIVVRTPEELLHYVRRV